MIPKKERVEKVAKALKAYAKIKASQHHIVERITNWAAMGRNEIGLHNISEASAAKLRKVGFKVRKGPNTPPDMIKYIVNWQHI